MNLTLFPLGKKALSTPLPLVETESQRLIAFLVALKNHIFMSVNESETCGWNFLA